MKKLILALILSVQLWGLSAQCLTLPTLTPKENSTSANVMDSDLDLCTTRYVESMTTRAFFEGKEEFRSEQINDLKIENLLLKAALVYLAVNRAN